MAKILLANGDSWGYGSEIACPEILNIPDPQGFGKPNRYKPGMFDTFPINDYYRLPRIWPTQLSEHLNLKCVNLSWPARCNDNILASTQHWVLEFLKNGGKPSDVFAVIGWSSPERKNIIIDEADDKIYYQTFWPAQIEDDFYSSPAAKKFSPFYKQYLFLEAEYLERFISQAYTMHTFLKLHGIKHVMFNAFYHYDRAFHESHVDLNLLSRIDKLEELDRKGRIAGWHEETFNFNARLTLMRNMWNSIPSSEFLFKDTWESFKSIINANMKHSECMINMHPSPEGHRYWANFLSQKIRVRL